MLNDSLQGPFQVVGTYNPALCHPSNHEIPNDSFTLSVSIDRHNDVGAPCAATSKLPLSDTLIRNFETCFVHERRISFL